MKPILLLTLVLPAVYSCSNGYVASSAREGYCIKVFSTPQSRSVAASQCIGDGGYLASIANAFQNTEIANMGKGIDLWLGINCPVTDYPNLCTNDDTTTTTSYNNFAPGFPVTTSPFGPCVHMVGSSATWSSDDCSIPVRAFVCEYHEQGQTCEPGYTSFGGACYWALSEAMTLAQADTACLAGCGQLTSIHSDAENQFLLQMAQQVAGNNRYSRIGLLYNGSYYWEDGSNYTYGPFGHQDPAGMGYCTALSLVTDAVGAGQWISANCGRAMPSICKKGFIGHCAATTPPPLTQTCNRTQYISANQTVYSPGYNGTYGEGICLYILTVPTDYFASIRFNYFIIDPSSSFRLFNDIDDQVPFLVLTSTSNVTNAITSTENQMRIEFVSTSGSPSANDKWYFSTSQVSACSSTACPSNNQVIAAPGTITSPSYPNNYPNSYCGSYRLTTTGQSRIQLTFTDFLTETNYDNLTIYDGCNEHAPLIQRLSGSLSVPFSLNSSTSNSMFLVFNTDNTNVYSGFRATFLSAP